MFFLGRLGIRGGVGGNNKILDSYSFAEFAFRLSYFPSRVGKKVYYTLKSFKNTNIFFI